MIMNINISIFMIQIHRTINTYLNGVSRLVSLGIIGYYVIYVYLHLLGRSVTQPARPPHHSSEKFANVLQST